MAAPVAPSIFDCHRCRTPLPIESRDYQDLCPPLGALLVTGVECPKCGALGSYGFTQTTAHRLANADVMPASRSRPAASAGN